MLKKDAIAMKHRLIEQLAYFNDFFVFVRFGKENIS